MGKAPDENVKNITKEALLPERCYGALFDSISDSILVIDPNDFTIMDVNSAALKQLKMEKGEVVGKTCYEVTHHRSTPCSPPHDICPIHEMLRTGEPKLVEHTHYDKDGNPFYVEVAASPVKDGMGKIIQTIHIARNITERKRMEEELRKYTEHLEELVEGRTRKIREFTFKANKVILGESYLVESHERAFRVYSDLTMHGVPGLCFLRGRPERLIQEYSLTKEQILLLSGRSLLGLEAVTDLQDLSLRISNFLQKSKDSVILVDGLAYLTSQFGFDAVYHFIQEKVYDAVAANAILLFPVDPKIFSDKERALITSELRILQ